MIEQVFRDEWGRVLASLVGFVRDFDLAEDVAQEAFAIAVERWPRDGMPANPGAWLVTTARHRALDRLRRERTLAAKTRLLAMQEKVEVEVLEQRRRVLGMDHPDTIMAAANLAATYRAQGRYGEAEKLEVEVLPPDVQAGDVEFTAADNKIFFGLTAIKGLGRGAAAEIVRARQEKGPFKDLFNFCERIDHKTVPRSALEKLIKAGAFDQCGGNRAQLWEALPRAIASAGQVQEDRRHGQHNLFETMEEGTAE